MSKLRLPLSPGPHRTVQMNRDVHPEADTTDYILNHVEYPSDVDVQRTDTRSSLNPEAHVLFQRRLRLCCLVGAAPFILFFVCAATNFIELFGRDTVGWTGVVLSAITLVGLGGMATFLTFSPILPEKTLRVLEVGIFGVMGLFFAYWQYQVLASNSVVKFEDERLQQVAVLAASLIVNFNWFVLIVFHGVLVPNSLTRGAAVAGVMCIVALAINTVAASTHPPTQDNAGALFAISFTMLAAGTGLSVFGAAKTAALQQEVLTARETIRQMGQYRLRRMLGKGGMGEVYLAEHQLLKRPCAIKRIHPRFLNNHEQMRRFEREVQATAQLRHPNTVEIYDYGRAEDGTFYYVMEYLPGISLEELVIRHGQLPAGRIVHILRQVCSALREAHLHGLVHRDIKPSNVVVFSDGSPHDHTKLLDFGLVHSLAWDGDPEEKITREGLIVGTPEYMSPEQASGTAIDGRSDLFSVGSVAYYLLTGHEAFHQANPMKTLMAVVNEEPRAIREFNPNAPADLVAVIRRCLSKLPEERYRNAAELEHALLQCEAAQAWSEQQALEWWNAHPDERPDEKTDLDALPLRE